MKLSEYDVCFATKEYLFDNGYIIVTWNPPGSQGTFTIPNPEKDPNYRGQTGSKSPDLIAFNDTELLFVEAKDNIKKSFDDIVKLKALLSNSKRKELLFEICKRQMSALGHCVDFSKLKIRYAVAVPYQADIIDKYRDFNDLSIFSVKSKIKNWNKNSFDSSLSTNDIYEVEEHII